jgi:excisionase family DNA binding protein
MSRQSFLLRQIICHAIILIMKLMNTAEAAESLGVSVRRVRQLIVEGKLVARNLGRDYVIEESALKSVKVYGKPGRPAKKGGQVNSRAKSKTSKRGS